MNFSEESAELTPDGRSWVLEIAARMRSALFPVAVERSENNARARLDVGRRQIVAQDLSDLGKPDVNQRTFVSPAYGRGLTSVESGTDNISNCLQSGRIWRRNRRQ